MTWAFSKIFIGGGARARQSEDLSNFCEFRGPRRRVTLSALSESKFSTEVYEVMRGNASVSYTHLTLPTILLV